MYKLANPHLPKGNGRRNFIITVAAELLRRQNIIRNKSCATTDWYSKNVRYLAKAAQSLNRSPKKQKLVSSGTSSNDDDDDDKNIKKDNSKSICFITVNFDYTRLVRKKCTFIFHK